MKKRSSPRHEVRKTGAAAANPPPPAPPVKHGGGILKRLFGKSYPVIVVASEHIMRRELIEREVWDIMNRLKRAGFRACLVGGCVRDILLNKKPKDFDIATDARPRQVKSLFRRCFLIGRRFRLAHVYISRDRFVEVATFRALADPEEVQGGKYAANNVFGGIEEDALRRDFTINALYFDGSDSSIIDYTGGLRDLRKKLLRSIGDPGVRFREDPVRIIRAARFCAQLGFTLSRKDFFAAQSCAPLIAEANAHRLLVELYKLLRCGASAETFRNLKKLGLLEHWLPELAREDRMAAMLSRLAVVDRRRAGGEELSDAVLITSLLYDLFSEALRAAGDRIGFQDAYVLLARDFQGIAQRIRLPRKEWDRVCNTAARRLVLERITGGRKWGRFVKKFVHNAYFPDALLFFEILSEAEGGYVEELKYWKQRSAESTAQAGREPGAPVEKDGAPQEGQKRRRRKRRPRKRRHAADAGVKEIPHLA